MQCQRYEERIIELHSVIAELSKKMAEENDEVITVSYTHLTLPTKA